MTLVRSTTKIVPLHLNIPFIWIVIHCESINNVSTEKIGINPRDHVYGWLVFNMQTPDISISMLFFKSEECLVLDHISICLTTNSMRTIPDNINLGRSEIWMNTELSTRNLSE
ncbi:hypothetical protein BRC87_00430 [Halobacteriales archaeon QS_4_66_20]|nr:MAG: hypothetical protein BRC87_00430 [Halobacteriales archaeon QS_4_66_20]